MDQGQSYKNHARLVPAYHFGTLGLLTIYFVWALWRMTSGFTSENIMGLWLATGLLLFAFSTRPMILRVQDRLIRLEMRLRLESILPADLKPRIKELTVSQLIALRFASDAELPGLVREVLAGNLASRKAIKLKIRDWQADYLRA